MRGWIDEARDHVRAILGAALLAANPQTVMRSVRRDGDDLLLPDGSSVRLAGRAVRCLAVGKAAGGMAAHAQPWGPFAEAVVVAPHEVDLPGFEGFVGGHPTPDAGSLAAGERALALARACGPGDLLIVLLSGGASALCESPLVPLSDLQRVNGLLLPISDVEPGDLASLGSGPVSPDPTTCADALEVLARRGVLDAVPPRARAVLESGEGETPKPGDAAFARVRSFVLADNDTALRAASLQASRLGYDVRMLSGWLRGEARERGRDLAQAARDAATGRGRPLALLAGGETVVRVAGHGKGGRSQEIALAAMEGLSAQDAALAALGTDGRDGPTDAAGAIVDGRSLARAQALGLDVGAHLEENDSFPVFEALHDLIRTGPTGTNVRDVVVLLVRRGS